MKGLKPLSLSAALGSALLLNAVFSFSAVAGLLEKGRSQGLTAGIANEQPRFSGPFSNRWASPRLNCPSPSSARWCRDWQQVVSI
jgi:hypothetical protein